MERLSIRYDLLPRESEILHLHFWNKAFEQMKQLGVIHFETEGKHAGCWVMPFESHAGTDEHEADKILVRSNGTVTYTGKDIAYQMWKLGILGMDFFYRPFFQISGRQRRLDNNCRTSMKMSRTIRFSGTAKRSITSSTRDSRIRRRSSEKASRRSRLKKANRRAFIFPTRWSLFRPLRLRSWVRAVRTTTAKSPLSK